MNQNISMITLHKNGLYDILKRQRLTHWIIKSGLNSMLSTGNTQIIDADKLSKRMRKSPSSKPQKLKKLD